MISETRVHVPAFIPAFSEAERAVSHHRPASPRAGRRIRTYSAEAPDLQSGPALRLWRTHVRSGGGIRTRDFRDMSPACYRPAPPRLGVPPASACEPRSRRDGWKSTDAATRPH